MPLILHGLKRQKLKKDINIVIQAEYIIHANALN
jgi:hypothetical protein